MNSNYEFENTEKIILRDYLALERTRMANERTLFAYIRTSLYLLLAGIALWQLQGFENIIWLGFFLLALSLILLIVGIYKFYRLKNQLKKYYAATDVIIVQENLK